MDLNRIKYFCVVAESGNLRKAAALLRLSPGAISKGIKHLQSDLGADLFIASNQGMILTKEGKLLYELGQKLLHDYRAIETEFRPSAKTSLPSNVLRLGSYCIFTSHLMEAMMSKHLPSVKLLQRRLPPGELERGLLDDKIDVGITYLPFLNDKLDFLKVAKFEMKPYVLRGRFKNAAIETLPFVSSVAEVEGSAYRVRSIDGWPYEDIQRNIVYQVAGLDAALGLVRRGLAAVFCPTFVAAMHNDIAKESYQLEPFSPKETLKTAMYDAYLVKRKSDPECKNMKKIAHCIRTYASL